MREKNKGGGKNKCHHLSFRQKICYHVAMKHWSIDTTELKKDKDSYAIWELEQTINFGLRTDKINLADLRKYWNNIDIDPFKRKFLSLLLAQ